MEWNTLLLWISVPSCFITLSAALRSSPRLRGWIFVCTVILVSGVVSYQKKPQLAGYITGGLWALFLLGPLLLQRQSQRWTIRQKYRRAARYARLAGVLHPFDGVPQQTQFLRALALSESGHADQAVQILHHLEKTAPAITARMAAIHSRRLSNDWAGLLEWLDTRISPKRLMRDAALFPMYVRALGETGQMSQMLRIAWAGRLSLHPQMAFHRSFSRMFAFAFCGQRERVQETFAGVLRHVPAHAQQFWLATADFAAGNTASARMQLQTLNQFATADHQQAIQSRLSHPPILAEQSLTGTDRVLLEQLALQQEHEERFSHTLIHPRRPWVTYGLILANVIVFAIEWAQGAHAGNWINGGTMTDAILHRIGAMEPDVLQTHEYYRLFMANFLHYGYPHILMNMLALWILGPFVEFSLGRWRYLWFYLLSGTCVMVTVLFLQLHAWMAPEMLVGASGAIMAVIGATAAILLRGWYREKVRAALRRLGAVGAMVILQITFDHFTPQVSGAAHIAGMVWGFLIASVIPHGRAQKVTNDEISNNETMTKFQ